MFKYQVYGLAIESELELVDLIESPGSISEVSIKYGIVPEHLPKSKQVGVLFEAAPNEFIFRFEGIAAYWVRNGNEIIIHPNKSTSSDDLVVFLLGSVMGALLHQRNSLPLHGSAIATLEGAIIITGRSTVGKSSLAAALCERGYQALADDISVITEDNGTFVLNPGIPFFKLWKDTISHLNFNPQMKRVRSGIEKYKKPINRFYNSKALPISLIINLAIKNSPNISHKEIHGSEKFTLLRNNTYRMEFMEGLDSTENHFHQLMKLVNSHRLILIERPKFPLDILELAKYVEDNFIPNGLHE